MLDAGINKVQSTLYNYGINGRLNCCKFDYLYWYRISSMIRFFLKRFTGYFYIRDAMRTKFIGPSKTNIKKRLPYAHTHEYMHSE